MSGTSLAIALAAGAYLLGSVPFGLLLGRRRGVDVRQVGSGNIGATNVARSLGKKLGAVVLALDLLKGAVPMLVFAWLGLGDRAHPLALTLVGVAPVLGHCFPLWLRLHGGKGVSTSLGVMLVVAPGIAAMGVAVFAGLYARFRVASVGSMGGAVAIAVLLWATSRPGPEVALGALIAAIIVLQHRDNIRRLLRREELGL